MGKHHGASIEGHFSGRKGCDIFLEGATEALGKELSFLSSGSVSQKHPALSTGLTWSASGTTRYLLLCPSCPEPRPVSSALSAVPEAASSHSHEGACEQMSLPAITYPQMEGGSPLVTLAFTKTEQSSGHSPVSRKYWSKSPTLTVCRSLSFKTKHWEMWKGLLL